MLKGYTRPRTPRGTSSLAPDGGACVAYFAEWQFATDAAYCPFIFVDQDTALMRGLAQGWPKQIGSVWITRLSPGFERGINVRYSPERERGKHDRPAVHELVQLRSRNVQFSPIWAGDASMEILDHPTLELADLRPVSVGAGCRFSFAFTVDDVAPLRDLRRSS
ncbi:MAG: acetoacetate decarboxylase family protein [Vicinamibacterales bacterium]